MPLEIKGPIWPARGLFPGQERQQALAVDLDALRRRDAAGIEQRRHEIDMRRDLLDGETRRKMIGPA